MQFSCSGHVDLVSIRFCFFFRLKRGPLASSVDLSFIDGVTNDFANGSFLVLPSVEEGVNIDLLCVVDTVNIPFRPRG